MTPIILLNGVPQVPTSVEERQSSRTLAQVQQQQVPAQTLPRGSASEQGVFERLTRFTTQQALADSLLGQTLFRQALAFAPAQALQSVRSEDNLLALLLDVPGTTWKIC